MRRSGKERETRNSFFECISFSTEEYKKTRPKSKVKWNTYFNLLKSIQKAVKIQNSCRNYQGSKTQSSFMQVQSTLTALMYIYVIYIPVSCEKMYLQTKKIRQETRRPSTHYCSYGCSFIDVHIFFKTRRFYNISRETSLVTQRGMYVC